MDKEQLLAMMGIKPESVKASPAPSSVSREPVKAGTDSFVFKMDEWDIAQGNRLVQESYRLESSNVKPDDMADIFAMYFQSDPEMTDGCVDRQRQVFITEAMNAPDYDALHQSTRGNVYLAQVAATKLGEVYGQALNRSETSDDEASIDQSGRPSGLDSEGSLGLGIEDAKAVAKAVRSIADEVAQMESQIASLGWDSSDPDFSGMSAQNVSSIFGRIKNNATLRRILDLAGRYRQVARAKQKSKHIEVHDEFVGTELSGDIGRLMPIELAMLDDPDFELDALRRLVENQSVSREMHGKENLGKGPIVVCVDESGSMRGSRIEQAKAFALAMAWVARHQNRECLLVSYSSTDVYNACYLSPTKWNADSLMSWLCHFFGGGTSMLVPLAVVPQECWPKFKVTDDSDIILLTDGEFSVGPAMLRRFHAWQAQHKVRLIGLVIGDYNGLQNMMQVTDDYHFESSLTADSDAVGRCFNV